MNNNHPRISVVVPAYNSEQTLHLTLIALKGQLYPADKYEIIVVDDGSTDSTAEIAMRRGVKVIRQSNKGPAAARNRGWTEAKGDIVAFTDSDCVPAKNWLEAIDYNLSSKGIEAVGGSYFLMNVDSPLARLIQYEIEQRHEHIPFQADFLGSFNFAVRKEALEIVGGFNETFRQASGEDNDLSYRLRKQGCKLGFDKNIIVGHFHREDLRKYFKDQYRHGVWRVLLYKYHPVMVKGDGYSGLVDHLQPLSIILTIVSAVAAPFGAGVLPAFVFFIIAMLTTGVMVNRFEDYDISNTLIWKVMFFRGLWRGAGMLSGIWKFVIKPFFTSSSCAAGKNDTIINEENNGTIL